MRKQNLILSIPLSIALICAGTSFAQQQRTESPSEGETEEAEQQEEDLLLPELLKKRKTELDAKAAELEQLEKMLRRLEKELDAKITKIQTLVDQRKKIESGIKSKKQKEAEERISRLTQVTSKMPPEAAALYLSEMNPLTAAKILQGIKPRTAASITSNLSPLKAVELSRIYLKSEQYRNSRKTNQPNAGPKQPAPESKPSK